MGRGTKISKGNALCALSHKSRPDSDWALPTHKSDPLSLCQLTMTLGFHVTHTHIYILHIYIESILCLCNLWTLYVILACRLRDQAALNEIKFTKTYRAKITVLFPLLTKPEGSFLCSKESVILTHSDPQEPNPQPHFGSHGLTYYALCCQQVLYWIAEPSTFQAPIEGTQN